MKLPISIVRKLLLSRHYLELASANIESGREIATHAAVNLLQDAVEMFLLSLSEHLNIKLSHRTDISQYFDKIDQNISPRVLPFRAKIIHLNKTRNSSKHDGILPDQSEVRSFLQTTNEFLDETSELIFSQSYRSFSLVTQLSDSPEKNHLLEAERLLTKGEFLGCMIECRKALYEIFEREYDVYKYRDTNRDDVTGILAGLGSKAPLYARDKRYIDSNVREPFDFIVLDHTRIDNDLLKDGVDPLSFWNIWRLTPRIYKRESGQWLVRDEFDITNSNTLQTDCHYVFDKMVSIALLRQLRWNQTRWIKDRYRWIMRLRNQHVSIYEKADKNSKVLRVLAGEDVRIVASARVPGLNDEECYIMASQDHLGSTWVHGYVAESDVEWDISE